MKVIPYTTTSWKRNVGCLLRPEDKHFNWFLFGKKYYDEKEKISLLDVPKGAKFYNIKTGHTLVTKDVVTISLLKKYRKYKGYAYIRECPYTRCCNSCFCHEVVFDFSTTVLQKLDDPDACDLIFFVKYNYPLFSYRCKKTPTPKEIDQLLKKYSCEEVCKILYQHILMCIA